MTDSIDLRKPSRWLSYIFHPIILPLYIFPLVIFGDTLITGISVETKATLTRALSINALVVAFNVIFIPLVATFLMRRIGYISDYSERTSRDNMIILGLVGAGYLASYYMLSNTALSFLTNKFFFAALYCILFSILTMLFCKVSMHMVAFGGALALLSVILMSGFGNIITEFVITLLLAGIIGSARLHLGSTNMETGIGFIIGFGVSALTFVYA